MRTHFHKMHGLGNDFVILRADHAPVAAIADRRRGVGCDQVVLIDRDNRVAFFNPDGSRAAACGNGTRCVADLLMREAGTDAIAIRTDAGELTATRSGRLIEVDMGLVLTRWTDVPLATPADTLHLPISSGSLSDGVACSFGNPHVTFFVPDARQADMADAAALETHPLFPERVNVGVASVTPYGLTVRVWERGAGLTPACGSGACAAAIAAMRRGLCGRCITVSLDGGELFVSWRADNHVEQTGPVATVFEGTIDLDALGG